MLNVDKIVHAKWLLTCDNEECLIDHALVVDKGIIKDILPFATAHTLYLAKEVLSYPDHAILPGFINTHTHLAMNYFRGLADDLALMNWLNHHIWPAEKAWVGAEFVKDASLFAMAEMIRSGTTCFNDMYFFLHDTASAAEIAGIRAFIGITVIGFPTAWAQNTDEYIQKGLAFHDQYAQHPLINATFAPHAIYTESDASLIKVGKLAQQHGLKVNMHIQETEGEVRDSLAKTNKRPLQRLDEMGLVNPDLIAVHMTQINEEDMAIIEAKKPNIVHCPESNMKLASGTCPVTHLLKADINVALGTDGAASNNDLDMISEMRSAAFLAKLSNLNPESLPTHTALKMATINGAKALGIDKITGSLSKTKSADFIAINLDEIETLPLYHPESQIIYAAGKHQVTDVWVAGKQLMRNRQLLTIDETAIKEKAKRWASKIKQTDS